MGYSGAFLKNHEGHYLFQLRDENGRNPNTWGIFGGGIEAKESPRSALKRELFEELRLKSNDYKIERQIQIPFLGYHIFIVNLSKIPNKEDQREGKSMSFMPIKNFLKMKNALKSIKLFIHLLRIK
jgi:8-oxo-dGTP pyrophosphatase MutT (NUDIX family)